MPRVLIVDADAEVREVLAYVFSHDGFCVRVANQADAALRMAQAEPVDAVVTGLDLQPIDGIELIAQLRRLPGRAGLPAVIFTAMSQHEALARCGGSLPPGVVFHAKGGAPRKVVAVVRDLVEGRAEG